MKNDQKSGRSEDMALLPASPCTANSYGVGPWTSTGCFPETPDASFCPGGRLINYGRPKSDKLPFAMTSGLMPRGLLIG